MTSFMIHNVRAPRHARFGYGDVINILRNSISYPGRHYSLDQAAHTRFIAFLETAGVSGGPSARHVIHGDAPLAYRSTARVSRI